LQCGKIICAAEGEGPCRFCGAERNAKARRRQRKKEQEAQRVRMSYRTKIGGHMSMQPVQTAAAPLPEAEYPSLWTSGGSHDQGSAMDEDQLDEDAIRLQRAQELKNRLLAFDRSSAERSHIYDAAEDFQTSSHDTWKSPEERALALRQFQQQHLRSERSRQQPVRISLDLSGSSRSRIIQDDRDATFYGGDDVDGGLDVDE